MATRDWADDDDDLTPSLPGPQVTQNPDGTETHVLWSLREDGRRVRTTRVIRKTVHEVRVPKGIAERRKWEKFGQEKGKPPGPQSDTTSVGENIDFRPVQGYKPGGLTKQQEKAQALSDKEKLKNISIKCRICSGEHFTSKCPFKDTMAPEGEPGAGMGDMTPGDKQAPGGGMGATGPGGSYVPPHLRKGGAATGERMGGKYERDDLATLRVTNVSEFAEEQDLREMFERFGRVTRVFLAKDRETGRAKGFAFVSFQERSDAAKACEKMDGFGFGHLILRVEFAKKSTT